LDIASIQSQFLQSRKVNTKGEDIVKYNMTKLATALLLAGVGQSVLAVPGGCPSDGATPLTIGAVNPLNGFPEVVSDSQGLALQLCLDSVDPANGLPPNCFFDPPDPSNPFSAQIGFGAEGFWWAADATIDVPASGLSAILVQAVEAAFLTEVPIDGEQFPSTRLRIRIDVPAPGIYTVTHPYGQIEYVVAAVDAGQEVRDSFDIEFAANTSHQGRVGPLLRWDSTPPAPPVGFIGDGETAHTVIGSPCGTNYFEISGVALDGTTPIDLDGSGGNVVRTDLFTVIGQLFDGVIQAPLNVNRASYIRDAAGAGQVDIFAMSSTTASVSMDGGPNLPPGPLVLTGDGGNFFSSLSLADATTLPATVEVTASNVGNDPTTHVSMLTDQVTIQKAEYDVTTGQLSVQASSSDGFAPPTLGAFGLGPMPGGSLSMSLPVPPFQVTVTSSAGGSDTEPVSLVAVAVPGNNAPVARDDNVTTAEDTAIVINLLADNGLGADFDPDAPANDIVPSSVQIVQTPVGGLVDNGDGSVDYAPLPNFSGTDTFTYRVQDNLGAFSNVATVTVDVTAVNDPPTALDDAATTDIDVAVSIPVLNNDSDPDAGDILTIAPGSITAPANGSASQNGNQILYTPNLGFSGLDSFQYSVTDGLATVSATVTVDVRAAVIDQLSVTFAQFRTRSLRWDIRGSSSVNGPGNEVTIHIGPDLTGPVLGTADVDTLGLWRFRAAGSGISPDASGLISIESSQGGVQLAVPLSIRQ